MEEKDKKVTSTKEQETNELEIKLETKEATLFVKDSEKGNRKVVENRKLRGKSHKVFYMNDGSEMAEFHSKPIHFLDEETGEYIEPDNTLFLEDDRRHYKNGKNIFIAKFSCEEDDELFSVEQGKHRITVSAKKDKQRTQGITPKLCQNTLVYENVVPSTDMEYSVVSDGVKENIIVKEKADTYRYPFIIRSEHLTTTFDETSKRVSFVSDETEEEVFYIPAPFMTDAKGAVSTDVFYEVKKISSEETQISVIADIAWMNDEERVFPVTIDPQIVLANSNYVVTYSTCNDEFIGGMNHSIGKQNSNQYRMYTTLTLPSLPKNPRIKNAELVLTQYMGYAECDIMPTFGMYQTTSVPVIGGVAPGDDGVLIDYDKMKLSSADDSEKVTYTFDVTKTIDKMLDTGSTRENIVFRMINEDSFGCNAYISLYGYGDARYAPKLKVTYESSYAVNDSYRTHTHSLGRFGQGSVDLACGNLMFESEDFAWSGNRMPVTIKHLFNSSLAEYQYTNNDAINLKTADFSQMKIGKGWKLNIMQSIKWTSFCHEDATYYGYVYVDENGAETYFKESQKSCYCR